MSRHDTPARAFAPPADPGERPVGVLIVDDDEGVRGLLAAGLWHRGFAVWAAAGGPEAVAVYRSSRASIDVALLDVLMPGCDGPTALAALRVLDPDIRACFMTGDSGNYTEHDLLSLGALAVFRKPFGIDELAHRLAGLASRAAPPDRDVACAGGAGDRPTTLLGDRDMGNPTVAALAAYRRLTPAPPTVPPAGCQVDLCDVPEQDRPVLVRAIRELVERSRRPDIPAASGKAAPSEFGSPPLEGDDARGAAAAR